MKSILTFLGISLFAFFAMAEALAQSEDLNLTAPDGSTVTIERDNFGVLKPRWEFSTVSGYDGVGSDVSVCSRLLAIRCNGSS